MPALGLGGMVAKFGERWRVGPAAAAGAVWLVLSACALAAEAPGPAKPKPPQTLEDLDDALEIALRGTSIPGMGVAVIENDTVVLAKGYGFADRDRKTPVTAETAFRAGSISKSFVGVAAMMLVEEGRLSLDAPLSLLAPEVPQINPFAKEHPVRLAHLLEHTAGWADNTVRQFASDGRNMALADAVAKDSPYTARYRPGLFYSYTNAGTAAAALMVERAAGQDYEAFVQSRIFAPLGMRSATFQPPAQGLAISYRRDGRTPAGYMHLQARAIGALNVTPRDLAQLPLLMLGRGTLNGQTLLKPESVARIERSETTAGAAAGLPHTYGLANLPVFHAKAVFRGHDGAIDGAMAQAVYWPQRGSGYVVMWTQSNPNPAVQILRDYLTREHAAPPVKGAPVSEGELEALAGIYRPVAVRQPLASPLQDTIGLERVEPAAGGLRIGTETYVAQGGTLFQRTDRIGSALVFETVGRQTFMHGPMGTLERLPQESVMRRLAWVAAFGGLAVFSILFLPVWLHSAIRGRLRARGGAGLRLLPLLALSSLAALAGYGFWVLSQEPSVLVPALGAPTPVALGLFLLSLGPPLFGFLSLWRGLTAGYGASTFIRLYAIAAGAVTLIAAQLLYGHGWAGIMSWTQ